MTRLTSVLACAATALLAATPAVNGYVQLSDDSLRSIPSPGADFDIHTGSLLSPILIPRVAGTEGSEKVRQHFIDFFSSQLPEWQISLQNSSFTTPLSNGAEVPFVNVMMTRDPPGGKLGEVRYLTLVAHYDSKITPEGFIGATDSAAPCAMLMHIARSVDQALTAKWSSPLTAEEEEDPNIALETPRGVQILFLDGEEAFHSWTDEDSIYGARGLAEEWEITLNPFYATYRNPLDSIELFVLLDLLGTKGPTVPSYFKTTHWAYKNLADLETRLQDLGLKKSSPNYEAKQQGQFDLVEENPFLNERWKKETEFWLGGLVGDDHTPFLQRGVEILHMIPHPFPYLWHSTDDDGEHLDMDTCEDWAVLMTAFVAEWMDLEGHITNTQPFVEPEIGTPQEQRRRMSSKGYPRDELYV